MKQVKNIIIGISVTLISVFESTINSISNNTCTGTCKSCGGVCFVNILILPIIGGFVVCIKKFKNIIGKKYLKNISSKITK